MNIKRAKEEIRNTVEAYLLKDEFGDYVIPTMHQRPILLIGAPGIGKTQIMEQVAQECGIGLVSYTITHHTRQSAMGLPTITRKTWNGQEYAMTEYTMSEIVASIYEQMEHTGITQGILFIDEINCVSETLAPAMLQFLQCKTFGPHKIPEGWIIAAAGNPPEYNKSVREFDIVTLDRVKKIEVEADYLVWKEYAYKAGIHPAVSGYLNARTKNFYIMENTVDGRRFATPRGWEDISRLLQVYDKLGKSVDDQVVEQYIQHPRTAKDFANYLELYKKYQVDYQIEAVLQGQIDPILLKKTLHASLDERFSVINLLLAGLNRQFKDIHDMEQFMELLTTEVKSFQKKQLVYQEDPTFTREDQADLLTREITRKQQMLQVKKEQKLISPAEEHLNHRVLSALLEVATVTDGSDDLMDDLRESFLGYSEKLEEKQDLGGQMLEHAFDFVEAAFSEGNELALFMTELNAGYYALRFLEEYECERYDRYNQSFLFDEKRADMLRKIDALR